MKFCLLFYRRMENWRNHLKKAELYIFAIAIFWGWYGVNELKSDNQAIAKKLLAGVKYISTHFSLLPVHLFWRFDLSIFLCLLIFADEHLKFIGWQSGVLIHWNVEMEQECLMLGFYVWIFAIHKTFSCGFQGNWWLIETYMRIWVKAISVCYLRELFE